MARPWPGSASPIARPRFTTSPWRTPPRALELSAEAVVLDPLNAAIHTIRNIALLRNGDLEAALRASERGLSLNPGQPGMLANRALTLTYDGRTAEARDLMAQALQARTDAAAMVCPLQGRDRFREGAQSAARAWHRRAIGRGTSCMPCPAAGISGGWSRRVQRWPGCVKKAAAPTGASACPRTLPECGPPRAADCGAKAGASSRAILRPSELQ